MSTTLNLDQNNASALIRGPRLYALMSRVALPIEHAGWNLLAYLVQNQRTCSGIPHPRRCRGTPSPNLGEGQGERANAARCPKRSLDYALAPDHAMPAALASIDRHYTNVYGYAITDTADPWRVYNAKIRSDGF